MWLAVTAVLVAALAFCGGMLWEMRETQRVIKLAQEGNEGWARALQQAQENLDLAAEMHALAGKLLGMIPGDAP